MHGLQLVIRKKARKVTFRLQKFDFLVKMH